MTKDEILNGMSEEEFYSLYPTKQAWEQAQQQMAYGGAPFIQGFPFGAGITMAHGGTPYYGGPIRPYGEGGGEDDMSNIPIVKAVPKGYIKSTDKPGMYERTTTGPGSVVPGSVVPKIIPVQPQNRTKNPKQYENDLIELVKSGKKTVEDLVGSGAITQEFAKTLAPYSKKDYVRLEEPAAIPVKAGIPLKDEDRIDRKQIFTGGKYQTFDYPDVNHGYSQAVRKHFDPTTGKEIDPMKSFDPQGNYVPSFMGVSANDPSNAGTVRQTRYNTPVGSATDNPVTVSYTSGFKRGGTPCYNCGGSNMQQGGVMTQDLQGQYPIFGQGGYDYGGPSPFNYGQFPAMNHGGDTTEQGANQDFIEQRKGSYMNFIQNNVMKNMHQEESQKVQDAFMQMHDQMPEPGMAYGGAYMQGGGGFDMINQQNAALQNMYAQNMNQYQNQNALDKTNFRQANRNLFNTFSQHDLPEAKEGESTVDQSALMHQFAEEFGPRSRRNGLPLFPANVSSNMQLTKKSAKALQGVPKGFKMDGFEMTPKYGLLARTRMGQYMGLGPKSINYKFSGTRGYLPGEPQPDEKKGQYGPAPKGTIMNATESLKPYDPETNPGPGAYNFNAQLPKGPMGQPAFPMNKQVGPRSSEQFNQSYKTDPFEGVPQGYIPKQIYMQSQLQPQSQQQAQPAMSFNQSMNQAMDNAKSGESSLQIMRRLYGGDMPTYQGDLWGSQTKDPNAIDLPQNNNAYSFNTGVPPVDYAKQAGINTQTPVTIADQSKNSAYVQGPQVQYDATKDRSQERLDFEGKIKRKWTGVGEAIGQWGSAGVNKLASKFEARDYAANKKKLQNSMLAENAFLTSPLNAKNPGGYDPNSGVYQPDQYVTRYGGVSWGTPNVLAAGGNFEEGEELDLSPEEIEDLRAQGYDVEYLD